MWEINPNSGKVKMYASECPKIKIDVGIELVLHKDVVYSSHIFK